MDEAKPFQYGLKNIFGLTTRVAIATAIATTFGGVILAILPNVFFAMVWLSALMGVLLAPYAVWVVIERVRGRL